MRIKFTVARTIIGLLLVIVLLVAINWIRISRKVVQISLSEGRECFWQLNQWYSGRCILSCYEHGIPKGRVRVAKGLFDWPIAAFPGLLPNTIIVIHELDTTIAVFTIDLTSSDLKGMAPPASLATTVLSSDFKVRACTQKEIGYLKDYISQATSLCQSTFPLNDCNADPEALKSGLLRGVDMGTIPHAQRTGDFRYDAHPQIPPDGEGDYTEQEAREFLKIGVERSAISARFGEPISQTQTGEGGEVLIYHRPFRTRSTAPSPGKFYFTGFTVYLRDNKLVRWEPITGNTSDPL